MVTCLCLVLIILTDVMVARPTSTQQDTELEQFVENCKYLRVQIA